VTAEEHAEISVWITNVAEDIGWRVFFGGRYTPEPLDVFVRLAVEQPRAAAWPTTGEQFERLHGATIRQNLFGPPPVPKDPEASVNVMLRTTAMQESGVSATRVTAWGIAAAGSTTLDSPAHQSQGRRRCHSEATVLPIRGSRTGPVTGRRYPITLFVDAGDGDPDGHAVQAITLLRSRGFQAEGPPALTTRLQRRQRDGFLMQALERMPGDTPRKKCRALAAALARFEGTTWPRWSHHGTLPGGSKGVSAVQSFLFTARLLGRLPGTPEQIWNIFAKRGGPSNFGDEGVSSHRNPE